MQILALVEGLTDSPMKELIRESFRPPEERDFGYIRENSVCSSWEAYGALI